MKRWSSRRALLAVCVLGSSCLACTGDGGDTALDGLSVELPRDELAHDVPLEWWYYTGHLASAAGERFGFELTFFKRKTGSDVALANFALTDVAAGRFHFTEKAWLVEFGDDEFSIDIAGWSASGKNGHDVLHAKSGEHELTLSLVPRKPPVLHDGDGVMGNEQGHTFYYSNTRLQAAGTVRSAGQEYDVTGLAWMDHQWFDYDVPQAELAWDWFALQLDDDTELMLTVLRVGTDAAWTGTLVEADGAPVQLTAADIEVEASSSWTNPASGNTYPMGWHVEVPTHDLALALTPLLLDQELHGLEYTPLDYWEGAVELTGTRGDRALSGQGYVELTGYDR